MISKGKPPNCQSTVGPWGEQLAIYGFNSFLPCPKGPSSGLLLYSYFSCAQGSNGRGPCLKTESSASSVSGVIGSFALAPRRRPTPAPTADTQTPDRSGWPA